jgi:hypothetical protein
MDSTPVIHLFYEEEDNHPLPLMDGKKWMEAHSWLLQLMLSQLLVKVPQVLRRQSLQEIMPGTPQKQILLVYLSDRFLKRNPDFLSLAAKTTLPLFLVQARPLSEAALRALPEVQNTYPFYRGDGSLYFDFFNKSTEADFWFKLADLAYDLFQAMQDRIVPVAEDKPVATVYLAGAEPALSTARNNLRRELERAGIQVLSLPLKMKNPDVWQEELKELLSKCDASIHLIGGGDSPDEGIPAGPEAGQLRCASEFAATGNFRVFAWLNEAGEGVAHIDQREQLLRQYETAGAVELLNMTFEDFKTYVQTSLRSRALEPDSVESPFRGQGVNIYVLFDRLDEPEALQLADRLRKNGMSVTTTLHHSDLMAVRHIHQESLRRMDVALIFALRANPNWLAMKMMEVMKAPGLDRSSPVRQRLLVYDDRLADRFGQFSDQFIKIPYHPDVAAEVVQSIA